MDTETKRGFPWKENIYDMSRKVLNMSFNMTSYEVYLYYTYGIILTHTH